jgi:hypothetical protein
LTKKHKHVNIDCMSETPKPVPEQYDNQREHQQEAAAVQAGQLMVRAVVPKGYIEDIGMAQEMAIAADPHYTRAGKKEREIERMKNGELPMSEGRLNKADRYIATQKHMAREAEKQARKDYIADGGIRVDDVDLAYDMAMAGKEQRDNAAKLRAQYNRTREQYGRYAARVTSEGGIAETLRSVVSDRPLRRAKVADATAHNQEEAVRRSARLAA